MKKYVLVSLLVLPVAVFQIVSCNNSPKFANENAERGFHLAQQYCRSCHLLPTPGLLDKQTWLNYVLPKMGEFLGLRSLGSGRYFEKENPVMKLEDWDNIVMYYYSEAPKQLERKEKFVIKTDLQLFSAEIPAFTVTNPATTLVSIDASDKQILFGDGQTQQLYRLSDAMFKDSFPAGKGISNLRNINSQFWILSMGVLHPSDEKSGKLTIINQLTKKQVVVLDSLQRPVYASYADLNNDGLEDIVVCEFGNTSGTLSWFENKGRNRYDRHILRALPGAVKADIFDFNNDGKPDIISLMAQGDEGFFIYYNEGQGKFREERIVQLPPSYGSNSFQLIDFSKDGYQDIVATNGDNGDYPPVLKPYHGIRIYLNDGQNHFAEKVFLPVNGVGKAIAKDFDEDGDLDIASIAFFPDYNNKPEEGFIFWENKGLNKFRPYSFKNVEAGRWLTMDAGDIDMDGDPDIVLGNADFKLGDVPKKYAEKWNYFTPSILILRNNRRPGNKLKRKN